METIAKRRLDSEMFGEEGRLYYVDLMKARNNKPYLQITRADYAPNEKYERSSVILFEQDFEFFVEAVAMVQRRYSYGEGRPA
ncbi:hypothetical protein BEL04_08225 [Mucilaginibacter sp. PPCGB 2223]|uniref:hypothetical protein n=1 Tax=Mucilaginibacter sp. PPCGB 2223 TaxID=1886027 RepID=UPI0008270A29|nr:hypothetical protein [Mucilaginibacter sp. PPCGB 2223]OCX54233.1 hypothetical protein BEL04_08225 [Mucilaginibacter sp. PPCGB 2223]